MNGWETLPDHVVTPLDQNIVLDELRTAASKLLNNVDLPNLRSFSMSQKAAVYVGDIRPDLRPLIEGISAEVCNMLPVSVQKKHINAYLRTIQQRHKDIYI